MNDFEKGMAGSFEPELAIMGEEVECDGETAQAVVDGVEGSKSLNGALIATTVAFDIYIMKTEMERIKISDNVKVRLNSPNRMGYEGRVKSILPIEGGQVKIRIGTSTPQ